MKYGMPRKIDDERRKMLCIACLVMAVLGMAAWTGHHAWMAPFESRRAELDGIIRDGESFLARFDHSVSEGWGGRLEAAWREMEAIAGASEDGVSDIPELLLDTELYSPADRLQAERILEGNAAAVGDYERNLKAIRKAAEDAAALADDIVGLAEASQEGLGEEARSDLAGALLEMKAARDEKYLGAEECKHAKDVYEQAQAKAAEVRGQLAVWSGTAKQALEDAASIQGRHAAAASGLEEAADRARGLRAEALTLAIDRNSPKLSTLRGQLQNGHDDVGKEKEAYLARKKAADGKLEEIQKKAREECEKAQKGIQSFEKAYGPLLPAEPIKRGKEAATELEKTIQAHETAWKGQSDKGAQLLRRAETLRAEAEGIIVQLDNIRGAGPVAIDGVRAAALTGEMGEIRGELAEAAAALETGGLQRQLDPIVKRAKDAWKEVQSKKPDLPKLRGELRQRAEAALDGLRRHGRCREEIVSYIQDGRGSSKETLLAALENHPYPNATEEDLAKLAGQSETASSGQAIYDMHQRLRTDVSQFQVFTNAVVQIRGALEKAEESAGFFPLSREKGAMGWASANFQEPGVVSGEDEDVLVPVSSGTEGNTYMWEFDLHFAQAGKHRIEVKVYKYDSSPVNDAIDRHKRIEHDGETVNGGWIGVEGKLRSRGGIWANNVWIPNYYKQTKGETVVEGIGEFGEGYQTFLFNLWLSASPMAFAGWHADRLEFVVFVDGKQVSQFWHKAR